MPERQGGSFETFRVYELFGIAFIPALRSEDRNLYNITSSGGSCQAFCAEILFDFLDLTQYESYWVFQRKKKIIQTTEPLAKVIKRLNI